MSKAERIEIMPGVHATWLEIDLACDIWKVYRLFEESQEFQQKAWDEWMKHVENCSSEEMKRTEAICARKLELVNKNVVMTLVKDMHDHWDDWIPFMDARESWGASE